MQLSFNEKHIQKMVEASSLKPFSEEAISFLNEVSSQLFKTARLYSDVITFAYWCRKSALMSYAKEYEDSAKRLGRGLVFHIAPSNVPVNFAFSLAAGLLAGNKNVVRLSSKEFPQVDLICDAIDKSFEKYPDMQNYVYPVRYDRNTEGTEILSKYCHVRVIWGGDHTIQEIRKSDFSARAFDITFADRFSFCVIQSDDYMEMGDKKKIALDFYNDTYFSDQNACTSPHVICWTGKAVEEAKQSFWSELQKLADERYTLAPVQAVGKLDALCMAAMTQEGCLVQNQGNNNLMRIKLPKIDKSIMDCHYHSGFFYEYDLEDLSEILPLCDKKCQTVSYLGNIGEELEDTILKAGVDGVDRIVPIGKTMEFSLVWDGYDLIRTMSRVVDRR